LLTLLLISDVERNRLRYAEWSKAGLRTLFLLVLSA
jgi:hypothetical protein